MVEFIAGKWRRWTLAAASILPAYCAYGLDLSPVFSDGMVLQQNAKAAVWGRSNPGESVTLEFKQQRVKTSADSAGNWRIELAPMPADASDSDMKISAGNTTKTIRNVVVGEVWIFSGQSQIELSYRRKREEITQPWDYQRVGNSIAAGIRQSIDRTAAECTADPLLRYCRVGNNPCSGWGWRSLNPQTVESFSILQHHWGMEMRRNLKVPIGMIDVSRGCSSIENWLPEECFDKPALSSWKTDVAPYREFRHKYDAGLATEEEKSAVFTRHCQREEYSQKPYLKDGKADPKSYAWLWQHMSAVTPCAGFDFIVRRILPYSVRGIVWWQGETNVGDALYTEKFAELVTSYRKLWNRPDMPFVVILLDSGPLYVGKLNKFRMRQYQSAEDLPDVWLVSTLDAPLSERPLIHPYQAKISTAALTAKLVLGQIYKTGGIGCAPFFDSAEVRDGLIAVSFRFGQGLKVKDGRTPAGFELAGADGRFVKAEAVLQDDKVLVSSPEIKQPRFVRYLWNERNSLPNLENQEGLSPFPFNTSEPFFQKKNTVNLSSGRHN